MIIKSVHGDVMTIGVGGLYHVEAGSRSYNGVLERIVYPHEELTTEEVVKYYGDNPPKGVSKSKNYRLMLKFKDRYYLVVPVSPEGYIRFSIKAIKSEEREEEDAKS